jgi:nitroreductase
VTTSSAAAVDEALASRRSVRAFLPRPVERNLVERILKVAARAPSGTNMQPWRVYVLAGAERDRVSQALLAAHDAPEGTYKSEYRYYPPEFFEPCLARRRKIGWDLYTLVGIKRGEKDKMHRQHGRNFVFFDAPVGMVFTIDRRLERGSWLDHGMFIQAVMTAARGHGLDTCPQAAFAPYHQVLRQLLPIGENESVVCGMSLGYADPDAPENKLQTERAPLDEFTVFLGW